MIHLLFPDAYANSVFSIDYPILWKMGFRALIFDIDNTLVHHGADSTPKVDAFFAELQNLFRCFFLCVFVLLVFVRSV